MAANVGADKPLPLNGQIELQFDRLLQPVSITRQTFVLEDIGATTAFTPTVSYDPVAGIVTLTPLADARPALLVQQSYQLIITTPKDGNDLNGLRAIDGATLDAPATRVIAFTVTDPLPSPPAGVAIDFCRDIHPLVTSNCALTQCHGLAGPTVTSTAAAAAGLVLEPQTYIASTAIGRVSQAANTGPRSVPQPPSLLFGEDMPIIDQSGNTSNSWLMYKLLLATPSRPAVVVDAGAAKDATADDAAGDAQAEDTGAPRDAGFTDGGVADATSKAGAVADAGTDAGGKPAATPVAPPVDVSHAHALPWQGLSADDRAVLSQYVLGREMPYPGGGIPLTLDELERMSLWIAQGAQVPASCPK